MGYFLDIQDNTIPESLSFTMNYQSRNVTLWVYGTHNLYSALGDRSGITGEAGDILRASTPREALSVVFL